MQNNEGFVEGIAFTQDGTGSFGTGQMKGQLAQSSTVYPTDDKELLCRQGFEYVDELKEPSDGLQDHTKAAPWSYGTYDQVEETDDQVGTISAEQPSKNAKAGLELVRKRGPIEDPGEKLVVAESEPVKKKAATDADDNLDGNQVEDEPQEPFVATPPRVGSARANTPSSQARKKRDALDACERTIQALRAAHDKCGLQDVEPVELSLYRLQKALLGCLAIATDDKAHADATKLAEEIRQRMEQGNCSNAKSFVDESRRILEKIYARDFEDSLRRTTDLLKRIQPVRVPEVLARVKQAQSIEKEIASKDVVLMFGKTGSGKSTTVQYLAGQNMVKNERGHIEAELAGSGQLSRVVSSAAMTSETKELIPVEVSFSRNTRTLVLCDAPGFEDTSGPESDIASGFAVVHALQAARSVRVLALQNKMDFGARGDGFRELANVLSRIIKDLDMEKMEAVCFAFTKFDQDDDIADLIFKVVEEAPENSSHELKVVLGALQECADRGPRKINPLLVRERDAILVELAKMKNLDPKDLSYSASQQTLRLVKNQLQIDCNNVKWALPRSLALAQLYYQQIEGMVEIFPDQRGYLADALNSITLFFETSRDSIINAIEQRFDDAGVHILDEDVQRAKRFMEECDQADNLWGGMIEDLPSKNGLVDQLLDMIKQRWVLSKSENWALMDVRFGALLANVDTLNSVLADDRLDDQAQEINEDGICRAKNLSAMAKDYAREKRFHELNQILIYLNVTWPAIVDSCHAETESIMLNLAANVKESLSNSVFLKDQFDEESDIPQIQSILSSLESISEPVFLRNCLMEFRQKKGEAPKDPLDQVLEILQNRFDGMDAKIKCLLSESAVVDLDLNAAGKLIGQMQLLQKLRQLERLTIKRYHETIHAFRSYVAQLQKDTENIVSNVSLAATAQHVDYKRLAIQLGKLKRAVAVDKDNLNHSSAFQRITEEISTSILAAKDRLAHQCKLLATNRCKGELEEAIKIYNIVSDMEPLRDYVEDVGQGMIDADAIFRKAVTPIKNHFTTKFDLNSRNLGPKKARVSVLESALISWEHVQDALNRHSPPFQSLAELESTLASRKLAIEESKTKQENELRNLDSQKETVLKALRTKDADGDGCVEQLQILKNLRMQQEEEFNAVMKKLENEYKGLEQLYSGSKLAVSNLEDSSIFALKNNTSEVIQALQIELEGLREDLKRCPKAAENDFRNERIEPRLVHQALDFFERMSLLRVRVSETPIVQPDGEFMVAQYVVSYANFVAQQFAEGIDGLIRCIEILKIGVSEGKDSNQEHANIERIGTFEHHLSTVVSCLDRFVLLDDKGRVYEILETSESAAIPSIRVGLSNLKIALRDRIAVVSIEPDQRAEFVSLVNFAGSIAIIDRHCRNGFDFAPHGGFESLAESASRSLDEDKTQGLADFSLQMGEQNFDEAAKVLEKMIDSGLQPARKSGLIREFEIKLFALLESTKNCAEDLAEKIEERSPYDSGVSVTVRQLCLNVLKVKAASEQDLVVKYLSRKDTQKELRDCLSYVHDLLTKKICMGCDRIKCMIDLDSFAKAEEWLNNLQGFRERLASCLNVETQTVDAAIMDVNKSLEKLADQIEGRDAFENISTWAEYSPKILVKTLVDLEKMSTATKRYAAAKRVALKKTKDCYVKKFAEIDSIQEVQKMEQVRDELKRAREYLPDQHAGDFDHRLHILCARVELENQNDSKRLETALASLERADDVSFAEVVKIYSTAKEKNPTVVQKIQESITTKLATVVLNTEALITERKLKEAFEIMSKIIIRYERSFGIHIREVLHLFGQVIRSFQKQAGELELLLQDFEKQVPDSIVVAIHGLHECLNFDSRELIDMPLFVGEGIINTMQKAWDRFRSKSEEFNDAQARWDLKGLFGITQWFRKWHEVQNALQNLLDVQTDRLAFDSDKIARVLEHLVNQAMNHLNRPLITDDTKQFCENRRESVNNFAIWYGRLNNLLQSEALEMAPGEDKQEYLNKAKKKLAALGEVLQRLSSQETLSEEECAEFKAHYELLSDLASMKDLNTLNLGSLFVEPARNKILSKVDDYRARVQKLAMQENAEIRAVASYLIEMKIWEQNLTFGSEIHRSIDETLKDFKEKQRDCNTMGLLSAALSASDYGNKLIAEHKALSGEDLRMRREKMQKQDDLDLMLDRLDGDNLKKDLLRETYDVYSKLYDDLLGRGLSKLVTGADCNETVEEAVQKAKELIRSGLREMKLSHYKILPEVLACTCTVWTLLNTEDYNENRGNNKMDYVLKPHVAQIISIFRIFGIGYSTNQRSGPEFAPFLQNCLVEVGTGEGKSFILAMVASIFALMGCEVDCSCYSEYLSQRDYNAFASVFQALNVETSIQYNTFNKICENLLNQSCIIRDQVREAILENNVPKGIGSVKSSFKPRILLIDEVDVFLSDRYYGGMYVPTVLLSGRRFSELLDYIWSNRGRLNESKSGFDCLLSIKDFREGKVPVFNACLNAHSRYETLLLEAVKDMIAALKTALSVHYRVEDNKVQYLEGDAYVSNVMHGYQTVWTYYYEFEQKTLSKAAFDLNTGLLVNCGVFSYAEIPEKYAFIAGVTGTLRTLSSEEHRILREAYKIHSKTFMPSVFGECNRNYNPASDIHVVSAAEHYDRIISDIDEKCRARRAVLVFFPSLTELMGFYNYHKFVEFRKNASIQVIAENVSPTDREMRIKRCGTEKMVTLLTASFGRGTDFICRNPQLLSNGGVHVLQTFYSEEKSEEYQIMGRGARQGDRGSYSMILVNDRLEWVLGPQYFDVIQNAKTQGTPLHKILEEEREKKYNAKCSSKALGINQRKGEHQLSMAFMEKVQTRQPIVDYLWMWNRASIPNGGSRTVLLMDATGSMAASLEAAKETVCAMFERVSGILKDNNFAPNGFQMQFAVYRNYSSYPTGGLLQYSNWESNPAKLRDFMSTIHPSGGQGNEAIEIGLAHAADQHDECPIDQVILIGDMPPNTREDVLQKRSGLTALWARWFAKETYWEDELRRLDQVPVHAFYVNKAARSAFKEIARRQGGVCEALAIDGPLGAEMLTSFVSAEVLRKAGGRSGDQLVELYKKKYPKAYTS